MLSFKLFFVTSYTNAHVTSIDICRGHGSKPLSKTKKAPFLKVIVDVCSLSTAICLPTDDEGTLWKLTSPTLCYQCRCSICNGYVFSFVCDMLCMSDNHFYLPVCYVIVG